MNTLNNEELKAAGLAYFYVLSYDKLYTGEKVTRSFDSMNDALDFIRLKSEHLYLYNNFNITALTERA
jgi:hypothetical protein